MGLPTGRLRDRVRAGILVVAVGVVSFSAGWAARSVITTRAFTATPAVVSNAGRDLSEVVEALDAVERRTGAVVEILNDMAAGKVSSDRPALATLRDSMQEITEALGDLGAQLRLVVRRLGR